MTKLRITQNMTNCKTIGMKHRTNCVIQAQPLMYTPLLISKLILIDTNTDTNKNTSTDTNADIDTNV